MKKLSSLALVSLLAFSACSPDDGDTTVREPSPADSFTIVDPGKSDDYYSNVASEFEVTGVVTLDLTPEEQEDPKLSEELVAGRISAVGVYLTTYLTDKFRGIDINGDGEVSDDEVFFQNDGYGGFHAMVRNQSTEVLSQSTMDGVFTTEFTIDLAGPRELLSLLLADGGKEGTDGGSVEISLQMPAGIRTGGDSAPIRNFDPSTYQGELETIPLIVRELPAPDDAYPHYAAFYADRVYDISMVFGYDYNASRADLQDAREAFDVLVSLGFSSPVATFEELGPSSGPFFKDITIRRPITATCVDDAVLATVNDRMTETGFLQLIGVRSDAARNIVAARAGADGIYQTLDDKPFRTIAELDAVPRVGPATLEALRKDARAVFCDFTDIGARIDVHLFHADMFIDNRPAQRDRVLYELTNRDVVFYNGHAGPYYGFYLDPDYDAYIDDAEFAALEFDGRQRLFVAQGCQTYSQYADMLYANPSVSEDNLDVVTTVNYSYGRGTMGLFEALTRVDNMDHVPVSYNEIIAGLNADSINSDYSVFYGVIGIDQNPSMHPHALPETIGATCTTHEECGLSINGGFCSNFSDGVARCVSRVVAPDGCPDGTNYAYMASEASLIGGICWAMR